MGQRVIMVIEAKFGDKIVRVGNHLQWGYGENGTKEVLGLLLSGKFRSLPIEYTTEQKSFAGYAKDLEGLGFNVYFNNDELEGMLDEHGELDMHKVIREHNNDNGGIRLLLEFDNYGMCCKKHLRYYLGREEVLRGEEPGDEVPMRDYFKRFSCEHEYEGLRPVLEMEEAEVA